MNREEALAFVKKNGPLPEPPALGDRTCAHANRPEPCSCHLTLEQRGAAEELGSYTLYLFGRPYRGRIKVPHFPSGAIAFEAGDARVEISPEVAEQRRQRRVQGFRATSTAKPDAKREYDRAWRAAKAQGAEALAKFKAEWAAKKAAA